MARRVSPVGKRVGKSTGKLRGSSAKLSGQFLRTFNRKRLSQKQAVQAKSTMEVIREDLQFKNIVTGHYIKRNASSGRLTIKSDGKPFEGVHEKTTPLQAAPNPAIDQETAEWAEDAVVTYWNNR